jgi:hypothetical protein
MAENGASRRPDTEGATVEANDRARVIARLSLAARVTLALNARVRLKARPIEVARVIDVDRAQNVIFATAAVNNAGADFVVEVIFWIEVVSDIDVDLVPRIVRSVRTATGARVAL